MIPQPHLLVVDDDARLRGLLRKFLAREGYLVSLARDAAQARALLGGLAFDALVVDVMMPGEDGLSLTRHVQAHHATPVLLLTARTETEDRIAGLSAGADDYLPKPFEPRELLLRLQVILRRTQGNSDPPVQLRLGALRFDPASGELWDGKMPVHLTTTETSLLRRLGNDPGVPVSRADLAAALTRDDAQTGERAIDVQITRLRRKIETDPKDPRHLQTVRGAGYRLVPDR